MRKIDILNGKISKKWLTHTDAYYIIFRCDNIRECSCQSPGRYIYHIIYSYYTGGLQ